MTTAPKTTHLIIRMLLLLSLISSTQAFQNIDEKWISLSNEFNLNSNEHGFCYMHEGEIKGQTANLKVRLASTSKVFTTLLAQEQFKLDHKYETLLFWNGKDLHIQGSNDGFINDIKLFVMIANLNSLGIEKIDRLTFDSNFPVFIKSQRRYMSMSEFRPSTQETQKQLQEFLNIKSVKNLSTRYNEILEATPDDLENELGMAKSFSELKMSVNSVKFAYVNPMAQDKITRVFSLKSSTLQRYSKYINTISHNFASDVMYNDLGALQKSKKYLSEFMSRYFPYYEYLRKGFSPGERTSTFYSGSGLDTKDKDGARTDNYSTCAVMLALLTKLDDELYIKGHKLQDVISVAGIDDGTLKNRFNSKRIKGSVLGKTGTLMNTKSLFGKAITNEGVVYYGLFHQVSKKDRYNAKIVQDMMVEHIVNYFNGARPLEYEKTRPFFPISDTLEEVSR